MARFSFTPEQAVEIIKKLAEAGEIKLIQPLPLKLKRAKRITISRMPLFLMVFI